MTPACTLSSAHDRDPAEPLHSPARWPSCELEHRDLDAAIDRLQADIDADELAVKRLKKRKLWLKDCIADSKPR